MPHDASPAAPHNVPAALSGFVGRARDLAGVGALLDRARLVTLAGAGGVGKTRLARETAAQAAAPTADHPFPDGVWWVELAPLPAGADVTPAVAAALGVRQPPGADRPHALVDSLVEALAGRRLLVVLDNCEHVIDEAAALADALLRRCPALVLLATSREALGVEGEVVWPVAGLAHPRRTDALPLGGPAPDDGEAAEAFARVVAGYEAVALFVDRARAVQPAFALTARTAPAVAAITARLDGQPLALELAAAQVAALGVEQLATRLDDVFAVLTRGRRAVLPRHRTLRALLDWSYHLLAPAERAVLARLAVFRGPFSLDAVEAVCGDAAPDVLDALGRLVEQSLVDVREHDGATRYRLLETVRQYGLARLAESPGAERAARARHAGWVAAWTADLAPRSWSAARGRVVARLEREADEIRGALEWAAGPTGDPMTGVRIAGALAWFWFSGVPWAEARARTAAALAAADAQGVPDAARPPADQAALAEFLYPMSGLAFFGGEPDYMLALSARAAPLWDAVDAARAADPALDRALGAAAVRGRATMQGMGGLAYAMRGEIDTALREMGAAVELMERDGRDRWWHAVLLQRRALIAAWGGRLEQAAADFAASVARLRAVDDTWFRSLALEGLAGVELARGDLAAAAAHARESVAVLADEPDPWFISRSLDTLAAIAVAAGDAARARTAARLLGAAAALRARCGAEVIGPDRARNAAMIDAARTALGAEFAAEWGAGGALDLTGAFALAAAADVAPPSAGPRPALPAAVARGPEPHAAGTGVGSDEATRAPAAPVAVPADAVTPADRAPAVEQVEVLVFGPLAVVRDGTPLPPATLTPAKVRELLLYLALHPPRTKEQIALALWPDASPAQVRNAFHVTMHQLRRVLGRKAAVTFDGVAYALTRDAAGAHDGVHAAANGIAPADAEAAVVRCDVDRVLAAADAVRAADRAADRSRARGAEAVAAVGADATALAAWREALALAGRGRLGEGEDDSEWLAAPQARVSAAWAEAMESLARLHVRGDAPAAAVSALEALVAAEPLREGAHRMLMAAYVTVGEPARALAHYDALAALLAREVGAAPGRETRALADGIRAGTARLA